MFSYGKLVASLHRHGFYMKDLFVENVLVATENSQKDKLYIIDHESTRRFRGWFRYSRLKNLASALYSGANPEFNHIEISSFYRLILN